MKLVARWLLRHSSPNRDESDMVVRISIVMASLMFMGYHLFFFLYYCYTGWVRLLPINGVGIVLYGVVILLSRSRWRLGAGILFVAQLSLSCVVQVYYLGWDAAAQWYLPILMAPVFMMRAAPLHTRIVAICSFCASMFTCYMIKVYVPPYYAGADLTTVLVVHIILFMLGGLLGTAVLNFGTTFTENTYQSEIASLTVEANRDPLTQLWNRRHMEQVLATRFQNRESLDKCYLAMIDIDLFKDINDTYGHSLGDLVLQQVAHTIGTSFRSTDVCARWGGEEFIVLFTESTRPGVTRTLEKFCDRVHALRVPAENGCISTSVTVGFSSCKNAVDEADSINRADAAMYKGKNGGRNCIVWDDASPAPVDEARNRRNQHFPVSPP